MKRSMRMVTERLILDPIRASDKEDYFINISHDRKVLETFICRYAETLEDFDFSSYLSNDALFAIRLKETGRLIGIILYFDDDDAERCEIGYGIGSRYWNRGATSPRPSGAFWTSSSTRRASGPCTPPSSPGTRPPAGSWRSAGCASAISRSGSWNTWACGGI